VNCFDRSIDVLGLRESADQAQGNAYELAHIYSLLKLASTHYTGEDTFESPYRECLHRLRSLSPFTVRRLSELLNTAIERFDRGQA
jgi:hypothetical protein